MNKVYQTTVYCPECGQSIERQVSRAIHPRIVKHDSDMHFKTLTGCTHPLKRRLTFQTKVIGL